MSTYCSFYPPRKASGSRNLACPRWRMDGAPRLLIVLDRYAPVDLTNGWFLANRYDTTPSSVLLANLFKLSSQFSPHTPKLDEFDHAFIFYEEVVGRNGFGHAKDSPLWDDFQQRYNAVVLDYKPDRVLVWGPDIFARLNQPALLHAKSNLSALMGVPVPTIAEFGGKSHSYDLFYTLRFSKLLGCDSKGSDMNLAGYVARNIGNFLLGDLHYRINPVVVKYKVANTVGKVTKLIGLLRNSDVVSIDTETTSLNRVVNRMLTIQFAVDAKTAYIVPMYHKDTPFSTVELSTICSLFCDYFETNTNHYHIFTNARFDLGIIKSTFGVRFYRANVWDIFAGEFCLDEGLKALSQHTGNYYYSLFNLAAQYGDTSYMDAKFGKEQRTNIVNADLDHDLLSYTALDVLVPWQIVKLQRRRAAAIGFTQFSVMVWHMVSSIIHNFATMEANGLLIDVEYLFGLQWEDSSINKAIKTLEAEYAQLPKVKVANARLLRAENVQSNSLFGENVQLFNVNKPSHRQLLFIDVMGLEPVSWGKVIVPRSGAAPIVEEHSKYGPRGLPKIDKKFQEKHNHYAEVSKYTELGKAKKLRNSYVNQFIRFWGTDADFQSDRRIRPHFDFLRVVTGRTSASNPSLHQIPNKSELGKHIKRLFISRPGTMFVKVDYSSHEIRCWANVAFDKELAGVFEVGRTLRNQYKKSPSPELKTRIKFEGDVHRINASYFFGVPVSQVTDTLRSSVKGVVFGLIYGRGIFSLATSLGQKEDYVKDLVDRFFNRFKVGREWFDNIKKFAIAHKWVASPLGRRRYLYGYLLPESCPQSHSVHGAMERRALNSTIQGLGSDLAMMGIRILEREKMRFFTKTGVWPDIRVCNSVHDSVELEVPYELLFLALNMVNHALTSAVAREVEKVYKFSLFSEPEIDFELGATGMHMTGWDFSWAQLDTIIDTTLNVQQEVLGHDFGDCGVEGAKAKILSGLKYAPSWLREQKRHA